MNTELLNECDNKPTEEELSRIKLFNGVNLSSIVPLLGNCSIYTLDQGETLLKAGQSEDFMYLVLTGTLKIFLREDDDQPITVLGEGESVGEVSILDQQPTSGFVVADQRTRLLRIDEDTLWKIVDVSHAASHNLLRTLAYRLRFGNSVMHKIQNLLKEYEYDATVDPLTGFYNRRWLNKMLERLVHRCQSEEGGRPLSMIMMDIDHFKKFNDTYGHLAGDRALNSIAKSLIEHLRPEDTITRYGGEEFLAVLPDSDIHDAAQVAERLRTAVEETELFAVEGESLAPLTLSLGIAQLQLHDNQESLIGSADKALYRAKGKGRNQVSR
ncbi:MAG: diguanylate cyclase [Gammaproteobacteria bacterium]